MKTLVIHAEDPTTDFLCKIYEGKKDWTILRTAEECEKENIINAIAFHDRVIMLGHGYEHGLFGHGGLIVDKEVVFLSGLQNKKECVYIWCNADVFVQNNDLHGFFTGMFVSEPEEAEMYDLPFTKESIKKSNNLFAEVVGTYIDHPFMYMRIVENYQPPGNFVALFNWNRLYYKHRYLSVDKKSA